MIELREDQLQALDTEQQPVLAIDPRTGQQYWLIKEEVYKLMQGIVRPFNRNWDNPDDDDLIRKEP